MGGLKKRERQLEWWSRTDRSPELNSVCAVVSKGNNTRYPDYMDYMDVRWSQRKAATSVGGREECDVEAVWTSMRSSEREAQA